MQRAGFCDFRAVLTGCLQSLRVYETKQVLENPDAPPLNQFKDSVNSFQWKVAAFSYTSEYVVGGAYAAVRMPLWVCRCVGVLITWFLARCHCGVAFCLLRTRVEWCPGSAERAEHKIYIWDRENGSIVKTLEGQKEGILHLAVRAQLRECSAALAETRCSHERNLLML